MFEKLERWLERWGEVIINTLLFLVLLYLVSVLGTIGVIILREML